jgi:hypothetical protein
MWIANGSTFPNVSFYILNISHPRYCWLSSFCFLLVGYVGSDVYSYIHDGGGANLPSAICMVKAAKGFPMHVHDVASESAAYCPHHEGA